MKEHLVIRNFGPIREAEIEVRDLTIFVGPQATGKSLAAQALYFLRGIEDVLSGSTMPLSSLLVPQPSVRAEDLLLPALAKSLESVLSALEWWIGNESSAYIKPGTLLGWSPAKPTADIVQEIQWDESGMHLSKALEERLQTVQSKQEGFPRARIYIPAGRTLYSFLPLESLVSPALASEEWPGYILRFYETLGGTIKWLWRKQERQEHRHLLGNTPEADFLIPRIDSIFKGQIRYGPDLVLLETAQKRLPSTTIAAGQMEIWPFWAIVEAGIQAKRLDPAQIYFEEPEAHLHPDAQRNVMEIVAYLVKHNTQFVITTHSPYILYAVNNFLMAQKVLDAGKSLPADVPPEIALHPKQVAAYRFASDGTVHDIMDAEVGLIDEDELDRVADELGETFGRLQERLEEME